MQFLYKTVLKSLSETEVIAREQGNPYGGSYLVEEVRSCVYFFSTNMLSSSFLFIFLSTVCKFKDLVRCYYQEAKWADTKLQPPFNEYENVGYTTSTYGVFAAASLLGTRASERDEFEYLRSNPIILKAVKLLGRFKNDVVSYQVYL